ncbi:MAG: glutamine--fructose-6-phosphate transaminase (isomerizing) [Ardenticatenia bacterium]|nr:MAG: glutamine--fructose-6-phosphate transaminase (isomerizing) [Ardenticatenia bacterium]
MCGIVGYIGSRRAVSLVLEGLRRLEYRGYDSAGLATIQDGMLCIRRAEGKLRNLECMLQEQPVEGHIAIGHTRWATHGAPCQRNAHPHVDCHGDLAVIQNGIVENFLSLRQELLAQGHRFLSDTDTEVIVHLVEAYLEQGCNLVEAARLSFSRIRGAHAIVLLSRQTPDTLIAARIGNAGGVIVGIGEGEMFLASDIPAILEHTRRMIFLEDGEMAIVRAQGVQFLRLDGSPISKSSVEIPWDPVSAAKGPYRHFMQKEILEQARSITDTLRGRIDFASGQVELPELNLPPEDARAIDKIVIVACGTSAYAGLVGKFMLEKLARIPVEVDYASEFRYRDPLVTPDTLVLAITQSGETADTLAALEEARAKGARTASIVNVIGSMAQRISDGFILMQAGPEIGVASTKAFTASLVDLLLLAAYLGQARGTLSQHESQQLAQHLAELPQRVGTVLSEGYNDYQTLAEEFHRCEHFLYLGRGINYPIALEGALKLKEISYIHAEGYPAGEMKHGPIALIDRNMPVVTIAVHDNVYDKMISQIEQVKARGGIVVAVCHTEDEAVQAKADYVLRIPYTDPLLIPILAVLPLQLLAYHLAVRRGCDVDQPRNLAKSVTVE